MRHEEYIEPIPGKIHNLTGADTDLKTVLGYAGAAVDVSRFNDGRTQPEVSVVRIDGLDYPLGAMLKGPMDRLTALEPLDALSTRGDILIQGATGPKALPLSTNGKVLAAGVSEPEWTDPKALVYTMDTMPEYIRSAAPTAENAMYEGMLLYNTTDHSLKVCTTRGLAEWDTVTVSGPATSDGDITITLNGEAVVVSVLKDATPVQIAANIRAAAFTGWTITEASSDTINFKKDAVGICSAPTASGGTTGVTFSDFTRTVSGVNPVWGTLINA